MFQPIVDRVSYGGCLIDQREKDAINEVINASNGKMWTLGKNSIEFERELADVTGMKYAVVVNSGSSALLTAMTALHLPKGSKVIVPALNFPTAYASILQCGLIPVVVDCELDSLNIDPWQIDQALQEHNDVQAIVAVNIAGNCVNAGLIHEIADGHNPNIKLIIDNCDGYGSTLGEHFIDKYADISCISMHAAHIISMGEGGAVFTDNEEYAIRSRKIREWGRASGSDQLTKHEGLPADYRERYVYEEIGYNFKPLELQCAMGRVQLTKLQDFKKRRRHNYELLCQELDGAGFEFMRELADADNCWFSFPMLVKDRATVMKRFEDNNIETRTIFSGNILRHPAYKNEPHIKIGDLKNSDIVMKDGMFLSAHPQLTDDMIAFMGTVAHQI